MPTPKSCLPFNLPYSLDITPLLFGNQMQLQVWGGGYNCNQSHLYTLFPRCGVREGNSNGKIVRHLLMQLVMKLVVAQLCRAKDHEIINEGAECVRSEFLHLHQLASSLSLYSQSLGRRIAGQQVAVVVLTSCTGSCFNQLSGYPGCSRAEETVVMQCIVS